MTLGAGDRSKVASGANGRTAPKSLTTLTGFGSRLPHNFFRSADTLPLGVTQVGGSDGGAVGPLWRSRHPLQSHDLFEVANCSVGKLTDHEPALLIAHGGHHD